MLKWIKYAKDGKIEFQWGNEIYKIRDPMDVILVEAPLEEAEKWIRLYYGFLSGVRAKDLTITVKVESSAYYAALKKASETVDLDLYDQITALRTLAESLSMNKAVVYLNEKLGRCICGYMPEEL